MKLKYYLRGLGIGVIVTALLMGFALSGKKETMSDEQIRERAIEMGMVDAEDGVLADDLGQSTAEDEADGADEPPVSENNAEATEITDGAADADAAKAETADSAVGAETENASETTGSATAADAAGTEATDVTKTTDSAAGTEPTDGSTIRITIQSGDGSRSVANKLQEAGVIDDAAAFDTFLCQNGYDKRIAAGDHEIPAGATQEEIAKALTR